MQTITDVKLTSSPTPYRDKVRAMKRRRGELGSSDLGVIRAFGALSEAAISPGALDEKTKELIALAIAVVERCDECIAIHAEEAVKSGATKQESPRPSAWLSSWAAGRQSCMPRMRYRP